MLVEYCQCVDDTPMLVTDIMNKLFETLKVRVIYFIPLNEKRTLATKQQYHQHLCLEAWHTKKLRMLTRFDGGGI